VLNCQVFESLPVPWATASRTFSSEERASTSLTVMVTVASLSRPSPPMPVLQIGSIAAPVSLAI